MYVQLFLLEQRLSPHYFTITASKSVKLTVSISHVSNDFVAISTTLAGCCQLHHAAVEVYMWLNVDLACFDLCQYTLVSLHTLKHFIEPNEHLLAAILEHVPLQEHIGWLQVTRLTLYLWVQVLLQMLRPRNQSSDTMHAELCLTLSVTDVFAEVQKYLILSYVLYLLLQVA